MNFCSNCGNRLGDNAKFCSSCGQAVVNSSVSSPEKNTVKNDAVNAPQSTCPICGMPINSFAAICPACGCEINNKVSSNSCKALSERLDELEAKRPKKGVTSMIISLVNKATEKEELDPTDQKKVELIGNYIVPSTKIEILDFLILANTRIEACESQLKACKDDEHTKFTQKQLKDIWMVKLNEVIKRGNIVLAGDSDYIKLRDTITAEFEKMYKGKGLCTYCGGTFKGVFKKVCSNCGKPKNY